MLKLIRAARVAVMVVDTMGDEAWFELHDERHMQQLKMSWYKVASWREDQSTRMAQVLNDRHTGPFAPPTIDPRRPIEPVNPLCCWGKLKMWLRRVSWVQVSKWIYQTIQSVQIRWIGPTRYVVSDWRWSKSNPRPQYAKVAILESIEAECVDLGSTTCLIWALARPEHYPISSGASAKSPNRSDMMYMNQRLCKSDSRPRNAKTRLLELIKDKRALGSGAHSRWWRTKFIVLSSLGWARTMYNGNILVYQITRF